MDVREEIPIKSFSVAAYIGKIETGRGRYLVIKRRSSYLRDTWQMISGRIEPGEKGWQAALREIKEETGLVPDRLYSANQLEQFYEVSQNCINLVPVFVGFVDTDQSVILSPEHSEYRWIEVHKAADYLRFDHQRTMLQFIEREFVQQEPNEFLRINVV
jgi:dATP pyrophosphohydrolase